MSGLRRWSTAAWVAVIAGFALLHAGHLRADFPNGSPWVFDWAKYTDEGWYGNAAARAHLFGNWYVAGDFNPAVAVPVWPFVEWLLYFCTGVSVEAARGLAVACFFANLALSYLLLRARGSRWMALLGVTLLATSPFLYCFSRLAILEPLQTTLTLAALILAVRLPRMRRPVLVAMAIGALMTLVALTKTTGVFLVPAVMWAIAAVLWERRRLAFKCAGAMACTAATGYALWIALIAGMGLYADYKYYFFVNDYPKPTEFYWPLVAFRWSLHGLLWVDHSLVLLAAGIAVSVLAATRSEWARRMWSEPLFGCSLLAVAGYVLFMTLQNHPQPRYFAVPAFFCFFVVALGVEVLVREPGVGKWVGLAVAAAAAISAGVHGAETIGYATHPEYTWVNAAAQLTHYIDAHPNGNRLLVSISGDEITLITHLPSLCDDFGTEDLAAKTAAYQPGWYASWNDIDAGTIQDLHVHFSLEQVAEFKAFDDPGRNVLVLFKLHPLAGGAARDPDDPRMTSALPDDKIDVEIDPD
jgi:hypothetical protein